MPSPNCGRRQVQLEFLWNVKAKLATLWLAKCDCFQTMAWKRIGRPLLRSSWDKDNVKRAGDPSHQQSGYALRGIVLKFFFNSFETFQWIFHVSLSCHARAKHISKVQMSTHWPWQDLDVWMSEQWTGLGLISPQWKVATPLAQLTNHLNKSLLTDLRVPGRLGTREKRFIGHELKNLL